jgi:hypothetical protein
VVKVEVVYRPNDHYHRLIAYTWYLRKDGKGPDGGPGEHFTREGETVDIPAFLARLWKAPWCFKIILSPAAERSVDLPLEKYA